MTLARLLNLESPLGVDTLREFSALLVSEQMLLVVLSAIAISPTTWSSHPRFLLSATQPMDNLVSMKGIAENRNKSWGEMAAAMGTRDLFLKGLWTRIIMIGTLTGMQWYIYGSFKAAVGLGTS